MEVTQNVYPVQCEAYLTGGFGRKWVKVNLSVLRGLCERSFFAFQNRFNHPIQITIRHRRPRRQAQSPIKQILRHLSTSYRIRSRRKWVNWCKEITQNSLGRFWVKGRAVNQHNSPIPISLLSNVFRKPLQQHYPPVPISPVTFV